MNRFLLLICLLLITLFPLCADVLELLNGDTITGKIILMNEEEIIVKTEYGKLTIKREYIKKGEFTGDGKVLVESGSPGSQDTIPVRYDYNIPEDGLVCELLFDHNFSDTSGRLYSIQNIGNTGFGKGINGMENHAVISDGTGKYLVLNNHEDIDNLGSFSISFWINTGNYERIQYILSKWTSTDGKKAKGKLAVQTKQGFITCYIVDSDGFYHNVYTEKPFKFNVWNHIVVIYDKGAAVIYMNKQAAGNKTFDIPGLRIDTSPLYILTAISFTENTYAYYNLVGMIDNLRIYNRALNEDEIAALFYEKKDSDENNY